MNRFVFIEFYIRGEFHLMIHASAGFLTSNVIHEIEINCDGFDSYGQCGYDGADRNIPNAMDMTR